MKSLICKIAMISMVLNFLLGVCTANAADSLTLTIPGVSAQRGAKVNTYFSTYDNGNTSYTMVPQGLCFANNYAVFSGYDKPESSKTKTRPSVLWIKNAKTGKLLTTVELPEKVHAGGVCFDGTYLWVASSTNKVRWIRFSDIEKQIGKGYSEISFTSANDNKGKMCVPISIESGVLKTGTNTELSTLTYYGGFLYTAEFSDNNKDKPKLTKFSITKSNGKPSGLTKKAAYDLPTKVQGIQLYKSNNVNYVLLSRSYGRKAGSTSRIDVCKLNGLKNPVKTKDLSAKNTYLMLEGIAVNGDYLYAITESAAWYYKKGSLFAGKSPKPRDDVYSIKLSDLLK